MTKQVHKREMVAHLWAHKAQDTARVAGGNFWFTGATLYSYGSHFVCAHHLPAEYNRDGRALALFNAGRYSMTTGRHMDAAWRALPGSIDRVDVPGLDENMVRGISRYGCGDVVAELLAHDIRDGPAGGTDKDQPARRVRRTIRQAAIDAQSDVLVEPQAAAGDDAVRPLEPVHERRRSGEHEIVRHVQAEAVGEPEVGVGYDDPVRLPGCEARDHRCAAVVEEAVRVKQKPGIREVERPRGAQVDFGWRGAVRSVETDVCVGHGRLLHGVVDEGDPPAAAAATPESLP